MRQPIDGYGTVPQRILVVAIIVVPLMLMVVVLPLMSHGSIFSHDAGNVRFVVARDLPIGSSRAAVDAFVDVNFDDHAWFPAEHCLAARFSTYTGGGKMPRQPRDSVQVYFYFDDNDRLIRVADHQTMFAEPFETPKPR